MDGLQSPVLELRSSTFFAPVLVLYSNDMNAIAQRLREKIASAPDFFKNSPILFDLSELNENAKEIDVNALVTLLRELSLFPVGIRGGNTFQENQALALSIPVDSGRSSGNVSLELQSKPDTLPETQTMIVKEVSYAPAMLITQPVRSGQRIYAKGDLVILAQVSAGAEIMAEGNIHVYNTLRGRALAGVQGDTAARFFCLDLQAELVSIAGVYKTSEDLKGSTIKKPVQVYLQDQALIVEELDYKYF
jgi:septum site-determining protein MinC